LEWEEMATWTIEMVLNRAVAMENQSYGPYVWARDRVLSPEAKTLLKELAEEELMHKEKISEVLKNREKISELGSGVEKVEDLKIVDWLEDTRLSEDATYQEILIFAGKREKETYEYYQELSQRFGEDDVGKLFPKLAQEELKHKNRIEREYDDYVLRET